MEDIVDPAAERHMYIPLNFSADIPWSPAASCDLGNDEMVARVVAFFQTIQNNHLLRQLQRAEGHHDQPYNTPCFPQHHDHAHSSSAACHNNDDSFTSTTAAEDVSLTELGLTPSLVAEQQDLWNRAKQQTEQPVIPEWLHKEARQQGRRIRVVTVDDSTATKTVTCIGCRKNMLAACHVEIVFCPECGCTFAPDMV